MTRVENNNTTMIISAANNNNTDAENSTTVYDLSPLDAGTNQDTTRSSPTTDHSYTCFVDDERPMLLSKTVSLPASPVSVSSFSILPPQLLVVPYFCLSRQSSLPPRMETVSTTSTTSSTVSAECDPDTDATNLGVIGYRCSNDCSNNHCNHGVIKRGVQQDNDDHDDTKSDNSDDGDFHDCSSPVSSQDDDSDDRRDNNNRSRIHRVILRNDNNIGNNSVQDNDNIVLSTFNVNHNNHNHNKRSIFSPYWKQTGQKPITILPTGEYSSSSIPFSLSSSGSSSSSSSTISVDANNTSSSLKLVPPKDYPLEDDDDVNDHNDDSVDDGIRSKQAVIDHITDNDSGTSMMIVRTTANMNMILPNRKNEVTVETRRRQQQRRSIFTGDIPPTSAYHHRTHPHSLSSLPQQYRNPTVVLEEAASTVHYSDSQESPSLTRLSSSSSVATSATLTAVSSTPNKVSCLRPYQRYSPSSSFTNDDSNHDTNSNNNNTNHDSLSSIASSSTTVSSLNSVRFDLNAVDVRHFHQPAQKHAQKGWSQYFF